MKNFISKINIKVLVGCSIIIFTYCFGGRGSLDCNGTSCDLIRTTGFINPKKQVERTFLQKNVVRYDISSRRSSSNGSTKVSYELLLYLADGQVINLPFVEYNRMRVLEPLAKDIMASKAVSYPR